MRQILTEKCFTYYLGLKERMTVDFASRIDRLTSQKFNRYPSWYPSSEQHQQQARIVRSLIDGILVQDVAEQLYGYNESQKLGKCSLSC